MALLVHQDFEGISVADLDTATSDFHNITLEDGAGYGGSTGAVFDGVDHDLAYLFFDHTKLNTIARVKFTNLAAQNNNPLFTYAHDGAWRMAVTVTAAGAVRLSQVNLSNGAYVGTLAASANGVIVQGTYHLIRFQSNFAAGQGRSEVWVDGVSVVGYDQDVGAGLTAKHIYIGYPPNGSLTANWHLDELYIYDERTNIAFRLTVG